MRTRRDAYGDNWRDDERADYSAPGERRNGGWPARNRGYGGYETDTVDHSRGRRAVPMEEEDWGDYRDRERIGGQSWREASDETGYATRPHPIDYDYYRREARPNFRPEYEDEDRPGRHSRSGERASIYADYEARRTQRRDWPEGDENYRYQNRDIEREYPYGAPPQCRRDRFSPDIEDDRDWRGAPRR